MNVSEFDYHLPEALLAKYPLAERSDSRLLAVDRVGGECQDFCFRELTELLRPGDLLVFNDTRVIKARLFGQKVTGGKVEVMLERVLDEHRVLAHVKASKSPKVDSLIDTGSFQWRVIGRVDDLFELCLMGELTIWDCLDSVGQLPLPPYFEREPEAIDEERYQTVYAETDGAVAAPTAGLHFDQALLETLRAKGVEFGYLTLHVGAGTFQPVRVETVADHHMHAEYIVVPDTLAAQVSQAKARGSRVVAVGTTAVRALESAANEGGQLEVYTGDTSIFIYPGYQFRLVDAMITNFHLPKSTLLMLVSAFMGYEAMMQAYQHAIDAQYRFYSYGDAMYIGELACSSK